MGLMNQYIRQSVDRMTGYVPGEQPLDKDIVKLNTNENPYPPSPHVQAVLQQVATNALRYYPDPVCKRLRDRLADIHACLPDQIIVGNGSDELLALCIRAFVERESSVGFFEPSYSLYLVLADIEGVTANPVPLDADFQWKMPEDYVSSLFFLCNPNAPTSILYPQEMVEDFCERFSGVVVMDEAYVDFSEKDCMHLARSKENVLVARTLSKSFSLANIRLGYLVGPLPLIQALYKIKDSYNVNGLTQDIALAAVSDLDHMRSNVETIKSTRKRVARALRDQGFYVFPSETNFLWVKPPQSSAQKLFTALRNKRILVRHFPGEQTGAFLRVTIGTDQEVDVFLEGVIGSI
ncbi:MAG: histidinol-phosphate transaminase [Kiritimatiellae bacterium]|nr:histidinol-phosphate transaminase [Kiritimatiellia bacterium]